MALKIRFDPKPVNGVVATQIPAELVEHMEGVWKRVQEDSDHDPVLIADSESEAKQYALYARAWGNGHKPRLAVRRLASRGDQPKNEVRLSVKPWTEDSKPGRKTNGK